MSYGYSASLLYENMTQKRKKSSSRKYIGFAPSILE
jgi:hypothetical protein